MGEVKQIEINNSNYYFDNDMINLKNFDSKFHTKTLVFTTMDILQLKK